MSDPEHLFAPRGTPVTGHKGMVAASQPLAVRAALDILAKGGNAADSAVAAAAALAVTEPTSTGIGGDCFALYFDSKTQKISAMNGSGRAASALNLRLLKSQGFEDKLPRFHVHTVTVPGACAGWDDLVAQHGRLSLGDVLAPAILLAEKGFPVAPITAHSWATGAKNQLANAPGGHELMIDGRAPEPGEIFRNPGMTRTLKAVAQHGKRAFYEGDIGAAIVETIQNLGGLLDAHDLAGHRSTWEDPISTTYRGTRVWECSPNGQGLAALIALNILEGFDISELSPLGPERLHHVIEALRLAFADAEWFVADPVFEPAPLDELLSKTYAAKRRNLIHPKKATVDFVRGSPTTRSDTVYLSTVDAGGNACSFINSNYMGFGTGIVPSGWGFSLQNRGHNFSLNPQHPNALAPGKRPYHTIIPAMATRSDGSLFASFGVMGGFMQPQGHVQVMLAIVDDNLNAQAALDRPRIYLKGGSPNGDIALEDGIRVETLNKLKEMGHSVKIVTGYSRSMFGRGQIIQRDPTTGWFWGGCDPRTDGYVGVAP